MWYAWMRRARSSPGTRRSRRAADPALDPDRFGPGSGWRPRPGGAPRSARISSAMSGLARAPCAAVHRCRANEHQRRRFDPIATRRPGSISAASTWRPANETTALIDTVRSMSTAPPRASTAGRQLAGLGEGARQRQRKQLALRLGDGLEPLRRGDLTLHGDRNQHPAGLAQVLVGERVVDRDALERRRRSGRNPWIHDPTATSRLTTHERRRAVMRIRFTWAAKAGGRRFPLPRHSYHVAHAEIDPTARAQFQ